MNTTDNATPDFRLHHDAWGRCVLTTAQGHETVGVEPVRAFPITDPRNGISLCDAEGREILWIDSLDALPPELRKTLEDELSRRHFLPVITRILQVKGQTEPTEWHVETDRGPTTFSLKNEEDVRRLANHRAIIVDAHGLRYLIPDTKALDANSRRLVERYI